MVTVLSKNGDPVAKAIAAHVEVYFSLLAEMSANKQLSQELILRGARLLFFDYLVFEKKEIKLSQWEDFSQCCGSIAVLKKKSATPL